MNIYILILIIALSALVLLYIIPAMFTFFMVFHRKSKLPAELSDLKRFKNHYFYNYADRVLEQKNYLISHLSTEVEVKSFDGITLRGVYYDNNSKRTAILFHGIHAELYTNLSPQAAYLYRSGFNVLMCYQRGHLKSGGRWTTIGLKERYDVNPWVRWAQAHGANEVLLYGVSMGAATITFASDKLDSGIVRGMVIDSGFYSVYEQMSRDRKKMHIPFIMLPTVRLMVKLFFKEDIKRTTADSLKNTRVPALFIHGKADETVECKWSLKNYEACASKKEIILAENAPHTLSIVEKPQEVGEKLDAFINTYFN